MQYCPKCRINIRGNKSCCPLCQGELAGEPAEDVFPVLVPRKISQASLLKIATFCFAAVEIAFGGHLFSAGFPYAVDSAYHGGDSGPVAGSGAGNLLQEQCDQKYNCADLSGHGGMPSGGLLYRLPRVGGPVGAALLFLWGWL